jgi:hypothetical protein
MDTCNFGIQYSKGRSQSSSFMERPKEDKTDMCLSMISSFDSVVAVYVGIHMNYPSLILSNAAWFFASPQSTHHYGKRAKTDWLGIRIMSPCGGDMSICELLFQWASTIKIQQSVLVYNNADLIIISLKINLFSPWYGWTIGELNNNHSLTHSLTHYVSKFVIKWRHHLINSNRCVNHRDNML